MRVSPKDALKPDLASMLASGGLVTDLRSITRRSKLCLTRVFVDTPSKEHVPWLVLGESRVETQRERHDGSWRLSAFLGGGVTDVEEDSAYALRLPLVGLFFERVSYQSSHLTAWVDPNAGPTGFERFHVPRPGYDPAKLPNAWMCETCKPSHPIVPEGYYVPPFDPELYRIVRGARVEIEVGVVET